MEYSPLEPIELSDLEPSNLFLFERCANLTKIPELTKINMSPEEFITSYKSLKKRYQFQNKLVV